MPESTAHDAALFRIYSLLQAWANRTQNGARIARNLAVRWLAEHPSTGLDPDVAVLLPGPADFDELSSYKLWEPNRSPPPFAVEVVSKGHPYKDYSWVHEGYAELGAAELLVFDPLLVGPKSLGGPVSLQLWRRDVSGAFERVSFGNEQVYSHVLDAWLRADGPALCISEDRAGTRPWPTLEEAAAERASLAALAQIEQAKAEAAQAEARASQAKAQAEQAQAQAEQAQAQAEQAQAQAEGERALRHALEERLRALESRGGSS